MTSHTSPYASTLFSFPVVEVIRVAAGLSPYPDSYVVAGGQSKFFSEHQTWIFQDVSDPYNTIKGTLAAMRFVTSTSAEFVVNAEGSMRPFILHTSDANFQPSLQVRSVLHNTFEHILCANRCTHQPPCITPGATTVVAVHITLRGMMLSLALTESIPSTWAVMEADATVELGMHVTIEELDGSVPAIQGYVQTARALERDWVEFTVMLEGAPTEIGSSVHLLVPFRHVAVGKALRRAHRELRHYLPSPFTSQLNTGVMVTSGVNMVSYQCRKSDSVLNSQ